MANAVSAPRTGYQTRISYLDPSKLHINGEWWFQNLASWSLRMASVRPAWATWWYSISKTNIKIIEDKQTSKKSKHSLFKEKVHHPRINGDSERVPNLKSFIGNHSYIIYRTSLLKVACSPYRLESSGKHRRGAGFQSVSDTVTLPCPSLAGCHLGYLSGSPAKIKSWLIPAPQREERKETEEIFTTVSWLVPLIYYESWEGCAILQV